MPIIYYLNPHFFREPFVIFYIYVPGMVSNVTIFPRVAGLLSTIFYIVGYRMMRRSSSDNHKVSRRINEKACSGFLRNRCRDSIKGEIIYSPIL